MADMAVKFADGSDNIIEGLAIPFGKDTDGEDFGPDTDLALDWFPDEGRPFLYHHGLDEAVKTAVVGRQIERWTDDLGHWVKIQLDKRSRYMDAIKELVEAGALGLSSGAMPHLVSTTKSGHIDRWPWVEISGTPAPAHPGAALYAVKMADAIEHITAARSAIPEPIREAIDQVEGSPVSAEPETYGPRTERVLAEFKAWTAETADRAEFRAKAGRELSKANIATLRDAHRIIAELLERADQPTPEEQANKAAYAEYLRISAHINGVPV